MKRTLNRLLSLILTAALFVSVVPTQAFAAEETEIYLPEIEIGNDILDYDVFYLATAAASVEESGNHAYLLRVGRGGPADSESSVLVKIADMTAKYGEDYVVRVPDERTKVDNPEDNFSLMEMIEDSDFEQKPISDSDEFAEMIQDDPDAQAAYREGVETAMEFLEEASGLSDKYDGEDPYAGALEALYGTQAYPVEDEDTEHLLDGDAEPAESDAGEYAEGAGSLEAEIEAVPDWENGAIPANGDGETLTIGGSAEADPDLLRQAVNFFTGRDAAPQRLTAEGDMFQDLQAIANVMTNVVVGASVELAFAPGETEKYLEIVPKDNRTGDGDRMFYVILGAPGGTTTNSAASTCAFTIVDDEEQEPAVVSFSDAVYHADSESVTVTVERSGAMNTVISTKIVTTGEGTAQAGRDYSEVDAELVFPFGVNHLTLDIPVRTDYLTGEGSFGLALEPTAGCVTGENDTAAVYLDGSYTDKASLYAAQSGRTPNEPGTATLMAASSTTIDVNNLSTYKTLNAINIRNPLTTGTSGSGYKGINAYNNSGFWQTKWKGGNGGTVRVAYELTDDYWQSYYLAGAEVNWWRSYGCGSDKAATMKVSLSGKRPGLTESGTHDYIYQESLGYRSGFNDYNEWFAYNSNRDFGGETRYIYPTYYATNPIESNSRYCYLFGPMWAADHPQAIDFLNVGVDDDCSQLWLWSIKPILRPFQVNIKAANPLIYLKADGTRSEVTNANTTSASIAEAGSHAVLFQNDSFTVNTVAGTDVSQYGYISGIKLMNGENEDKALCTLASNGDPSNTSITYTLNTENMQKLISSICPDYKHGFTQNWYNLLRENPYAKENRSNVDGYPTYVLFNVKPEFSYINASVTLRNPYDFPVTMTISGTDYVLAAGETRKIKAPDGLDFHLGDTLAVTKITLDPDKGVFYNPVGVKYWAVNPLTNEWNNGTMNFYDGKPVNFAGFDSDGRLRTKEIIVEPNLQLANNRIQVRIKTNMLSMFDTSIVRDKNGKITKHAGVLAQEGTVSEEYTYFTYADEKSTVNGKLYAITATPLSDSYVAEWYDATTMRTYVGNTLYFTAMDTPERNVITLSVAPVSETVTLEGTLLYQNYNLRTGYSGNASNIPAVGATLSVGSAGGIANQNGYVFAGPIPISGRPGRYLRYMVSINGSDVVKELLLPSETSPILLWDFGGDNALSKSMGVHSKNRVEYTEQADSDGNEFYTFTAAGSDPFISMDTPVNSAESLSWVKIRAKNLSRADAIELFACLGSNTGVSANSCVHIPLAKDQNWHEYIVCIPDANVATANTYKGANLKSTVWKGKVNWLRLDPMEMEDGSAIQKDSKIQIDYVAFFDSKETAENFRSVEVNVEPAMLWDFGVDNAMSVYMYDADNISYRSEMDNADNDYYVFTPTDYIPYYEGVSVNIENFKSVGPDDLTWVVFRARNMHMVYSQIDNGIALSSWDAKGYVNNTFTALALEKDNEWHTYVYNLKEENQRQNTLTRRNGWTFTPAGFTLVPLDSGMESPESSTYIDYIAFFPDEESARAFRSGAQKPQQNNTTIDISSNFPSGVSPVNSAIFSDIQITGKISDSAYQVQDNTYIPVVLGESADMTIKIKPAGYSYTMTGENGAIIQEEKMEYPVSVQLVVYDSNDVFKNVYETVDSFRLRSGYMTAVSHMDFVEPSEGVQKTDENGKPVFDEKGDPVWEEEPVYGILPEPGDKLYLRLVTDRLLQAEALADGEEISGEYRYSDIFTGMYFYQPTAYERPPQMGITTPIEIEYGNLPLIGSTGMDLAFPFVSVGIMKIRHGYRIYIGVSPVQIADVVKGSHVSAFSGAGGEYWKSLFSAGSPFQSFSNGLSTAKEAINMVRDAAKATAASNKANGTNESVGDAGLGSHSWRFDISVGVYFDFINPTVNQSGTSNTSYEFNGMGGYVSVTLGFTMAWYIVLPVVFLPAYLGIEIQGTVMGYLGATFNKDVKITYADALNGSANINNGISELTGGIRGYGYVQISLGVGLCGTLGVRASGKVNLIASWEPDDPNGSWGAYIGLQAGLIIDLFLFSIPLMYSFAGWPFGSFEYYSNPEKHTLQSTSLMGAQDRVLMLRESSGEDSMWLGDQMLLQGAFRPNKQKEAILEVDPYERPDSQLITLSDGKTLALAFIDSDSSKAVTQRTTLKLSIYDADTGLWSAPVPVSADKTADFQPSIAETKDGRLLVAWVSASDDTITDISTDEQAMKYLDSMDVYAAFVEFDEDNQIKTKDDPVYGISADTEITRISNDRIGDYYDANPTVVCDMESGDAIVYYIKSERAYMDGDEIGEYINPYTNDSVVSYMIYSAQGVEVTKTKPGEFGAEPETETIIEHWLFDYYYPGERDHKTAGLTDEEVEMAYAMLISFFGGQRFLDGPVNNENERYAIPDFTAIGYDGLSICAYTIDPDGSSDTDTDKELYLQVYDFQNHRTKYQTILTNNSVSDTLPQLFRSRVNTDSGAEAHTKLFWYRDGKQVVYIDVTELLRDGINADGTLKTSDETGTECSYTEPIPVYFYADDSHASLQSADFKTVEDDRGNLYILWTASVTDENGNAAREIFGTGLVEYTVTDQDGDTSAATSGWSKPYRITDDGYHNDELAVAMSGENLITVHNRYREELVSVPEGTEYNGQVDFMPIRFSDMALVAETMEPCGSVETESVLLYSADGSPVTLPNGGDTLTIEVEVSNNGMNTAQGYRLSLYADDTPVGEVESTDALVPNNHRTHTFQYTLPADVEGLTFKAVVQEMRDAQTMQYYRDTDTYVNDPLEARASYEISDVETYQGVDGFHSAFTVTNTGNAVSSAEDTLNVKLRGPANLGDLYADALYSSGISLAVGESRDFDVPVAILPEMMEDFGFVTALITVQKEVVEQTVGNTELKGIRYLSNLIYEDFDLVVPMNMELKDVKVAVDNSAEIAFTMRLGDKFGSGNDAVTYTVDDLTIAKVENGKVVGVNGGETTLHATHTVTGATVSATVTVTGEREKPDFEIEPMTMTLKKGETGEISYSSAHEGAVTYTSSDTGVVTVDENGKVTAVGAGTATITVTLTDAAGNTYTATCTVTVTGSSSTPVYPDPEPNHEPAITVKVSSVEGSVTVSATISGNTATITAPTDAQIAEITDRAGETGAVTIDLSSLPENITAASIPAKTVKAIDEAMEEDGEGLTIKLPNSTVTFDAAALASIAAQAAGSDLQLNVDPITESKLNDAQKGAAAELDVQAVYDIYLTSGGQRITDFGGGKAAVEIKHKVKDGQQPAGFTVWYVAEDGATEKNPTTATKNAVKFIITHFSDYVVAYDEKDAGSAASCDRGAACPMSAFDDLDKTSWYHDGVHWALENEIMNGYGDGRFGPNDTTSRAMIVTMLYRMEGSPMIRSGIIFDDVTEKDWYGMAVSWAESKGIVNGYGDGRFGPNDPVTREQLAAILYRYAKMKGLGFTDMWAFPLTFDDASDVSDWAYEAMCWMTMNGVINGVGDNKLSPKGSATRVQVATMLMRYEAIEQ